MVLSVQIQIYVYFVCFVVILRTMRELRKEIFFKEFGSNHILHDILYPEGS